MRMVADARSRRLRGYVMSKKPTQEEWYNEWCDAANALLAAIGRAQPNDPEVQKMLDDFAKELRVLMAIVVDDL